MDFNDTPTEAEFRAAARQWLAENAPANFRVEDYDYDRDLAPFRDWQRRKAEAGWTCFTWPRQYGGCAGAAIEQIIWAQEEGELEYLSFPFIIGLGMAGATLMAHASDELKSRYLKPMARGEEIWCQLFSEPGAGSDLAGVRTRAVRDGDGWVINGQKVWTSYANIADFAILIARTDPGAPKHQGLTYFILDMKTPGIEVRPIRMASGESKFNEVFLTDVRIPDHHRVGDIDQGWRVALTTLSNERVSVGLTFPTYFDEIFELACQLQDDRGRLIDDRATRDKLADWYVAARGLEYTGFRVVSALSRGDNPGPEGSIFKLVLGRGRQHIASLAMDMQDARGILMDEKDNDQGVFFQRLYLHAIGHRIAGGTDEILLNIIGERVLGLPADVRVDKNLPFDQVPSGTS